MRPGGTLMRLANPVLRLVAMGSALLACLLVRVAIPQVLHGERRSLPTTLAVADSPLGLLARWRAAYESENLEAFGGVFTEDYRFLFCDRDLAARWPGG